MTYTFADDGLGGYVITPSGGDSVVLAQNEVSTIRNTTAGVIEVSDGNHYFLSVGIANVTGATTLTDVWNAIQAARANDSDGGGAVVGAIILDPASPESVTKVWAGSQAEYDGLTPDAATLYFIVP